MSPRGSATICEQWRKEEAGCGTEGGSGKSGKQRFSGDGFNQSGGATLTRRIKTLYWRRVCPLS
ncbi:hypothetical protein KCP77_09630 [Salmonella enterica subsp. enterica]|nr:hypothetical protein KCP77_09630 [Salmonella enterica subsp. enterica]